MGRAAQMRVEHFGDPVFGLCSARHGLAFGLNEQAVFDAIGLLTRLSRRRIGADDVNRLFSHLSALRRISKAFQDEKA